MNVRRRALGFCVLVGGGLLLHGAMGLSQPPRPGTNPPARPGQNPSRVLPKLEPYAETKLIMEGLAQANFRGLERILGQKPAEDKAWVFGRGQACFWLRRAICSCSGRHAMTVKLFGFSAGDFRTAAVQLATSMGQKDFQRSRTNLHNVANTCNRCHQTFRVSFQVKPFADQIPVNQH